LKIPCISFDTVRVGAFGRTPLHTHQPNPPSRISIDGNRPRLTHFPISIPR